MPASDAPDSALDGRGRTMPASDFTAEGLLRPPPPAPPTVSRSAASDELIRRCGFTGRLPGGAQVATRFDVQRVLGMGATGEVYAALDHDLERTVAVKVLKQQQGDDQRFIGEARITAALQHPNVMPIYEMDVDDEGRLYFTMKPIDGQTLGEAISFSRVESRAERIRSFSELAGIFIAVANALACAHDQGIVHQDVKPDNIMLGTFGETLLLDWGSATRIPASGAQLYGTPLYMSPEQARGERADSASDIYCLGSTLFHALLLRPATWDDDPERFWQKKRAGDIDPPTTVERAGVPVVLLDIALKAMAADPAGRYRDIGAFVADMQAFLGGLAVSAHRDSLGERVMRWYRRHRRDVWTGVVTGVALVAIATILYGERLQQMATWGAPRHVESFADDGWRSHWQVAMGSFERQDGRLVGTAGENLIILDRLFTGDTAIEYTAEMPADHPPGDISLFWIRDGSLSDFRQAMWREGVYRCQIGAWDGTYTGISAVGGRQLASSRFTPVIGVRHRVRVEVRDNQLSIAVDGAQLCAYTDAFPLNAGRFGFYSYYPGKCFDDVRVYSLGVARKVPATAIGDAYAQDRQYVKAAEQYRRIVDAHPGTEIGHEALFKEGLCQFRADHPDDAFAIWAGLAGTRWTGEVALRRCDLHIANGDFDAALAELRRLWLAEPASRPQVVRQWAEYATRLVDLSRQHDRSAALGRYLDFQREAFPDELLARWSAAAALNALGRYQEVLDRYPGQTKFCCDALFGLGRAVEILDRYPYHRDACVMALNACGLSAEIATRYPEAAGGPSDVQGMVDRDRYDLLPVTSSTLPVILKHEGKLDEAIALLATRTDGTSILFRNKLLLLLGRYDELDAGWKTDIRTLMAQRRADEALTLYGDNPDMMMWPRHYLGLEAFIRGDRAEAERLFTVVGPQRYQLPHFHQEHYLIVPFLRELDGDADALRKSLSELDGSLRFAYQQKPWHALRYILGLIDEHAYRTQPHCGGVYSEFPVIEAIRSERAGDKAHARASYRAYLAIPHTLAGEIDPVIDRFVEWRIQQLGEPGEK